MTAAVLPAPRAVTRLRTAALLPALLALAVGAAAWSAATPYLVGVFHDDGVYALLAKALAEGRGFHYLQLPGSPAATHYPPLYPLVLGVLWWIAPAFPANVPFLLGFNAVCIGASAVGLYLFVRRRMGWHPWAAAALSLSAHVGVPVLVLSGALMSESLFLALLWPSLLAAEFVLDHDHAERAQLIGAGALVGVLMLCRTIGVALVIAVPLLLVMNGRWRHAVVHALASGAVLLPWTLWTLVATPSVPSPLAGAYGSYGSFVAAGAHAGGPSLFGATVRLNVREVAWTIADRVAPGLPAWLVLPALALFAIAFVAGCWQSRRRARAMLAFITLYLAIVLVTAFTPWRYLFALWPCVLLMAAVGAHRIVERAHTLRLAPLAIAALALPVMGLCVTQGRELSRRAWQSPGDSATHQIASLVEWVRTSTKPSDVVLAEGGEVITLYSGRLSAPPVAFTAADYVVAPNEARSGASLSAMLRAVPATYLVSISPLTIAAARRIGTGVPRLEEAGTFPGGTAFRVVR